MIHASAKDDDKEYNIESPAGLEEHYPREKTHLTKLLPYSFFHHFHYIHFLQDLPDPHENSIPVIFFLSYILQLSTSSNLNFKQRAG